MELRNIATSDAEGLEKEKKKFFLSFFFISKNVLVIRTTNISRLLENNVSSKETKAIT